MLAQRLRFSGRRGSEHALGVGYRGQWGDAKFGVGPTWGYFIDGLISPAPGPYGTLTPDTSAVFSSAVIHELYSYALYGNVVAIQSVLLVGGTFGQFAFSKIELRSGGVLLSTLLPGSAAFAVDTGGYSQWVWSGGIGLPTNGTVAVRIFP